MILLLSMTWALGTLRYEDGKARTGTAVDAGNYEAVFISKLTCQLSSFFVRNFV